MQQRLNLLPWLLLVILFIPLLLVPFASKFPAGQLPINGGLTDPVNYSPELLLYQSQQSIPDSIDDLINGQSERNWVKNDKTYVNHGFVMGTHWISTTLNNPTSDPVELIVEFKYPRIESLSLYRLDNDQSEYQTVYENRGINNPNAITDIDYRTVVNHMELKANSQARLYWRIDHKGDLRYQVKLWSPDAFTNYVQKEQLFFGIVYGLLIMLVFYNLFVFFHFKEKSHLYFVVYATVSIFYIGVVEGHIYQFLYLVSINSGLWILLLVLASTQISFALFARRFLNLRRWADSLHMSILLLALASAFLFIIGMFSPVPLFIYITAIILSIALYALAAFASYKIWRQGVSSAGYFGIAVLFLAVSLSAGSLSAMDVIPIPELPYNFMSIGHLAMILIFGLALADKIKQLHEERVTASMELVKLTEEKLKTNVDFYKNKIQENELELSAEESIIENRAKSEFLATMSHEIRTPMSGVLGMTELLSDTSLSQQQQHYVHSIHNSGQALISVINDLLDYSKIEAGKMELESVVFNLEDLVDDCISIFALKAAEKNQDFIGFIKPGTHFILKGDPTKLRQIILNMLGSALNFSNESEISLLVYQTEKNSINSVEIRIEILGSDFTLNKEEKAALFQPFAHSESSSSRKYSGGANLGLAVCKQLAELMHGDIGISSSEETGTTFWFTARLTLPHSDEKLEIVDRASVLRGKRLLVIDKHSAFCDLISTLTQSWGMSTDISQSITDAEEKLHQSQQTQNPYNLLVLPCDTEDTTFAPTFNALIEGRFGYLPRLIGSAPSNRLHTENAMSAGFSHFLLKPLTSKQLFNTLCESLGITSKSDEDTKQAEDPQHKYSHLKIMVAEDNNVNLMVIVGLLNKLHIQPITAGNGKEALACYAEHKHFDLILMDCEMPDLDGYEATREIRRLEEKPLAHHTRIVALSAHTVDEYKSKALAAGMDDYLTKPINREDIERILQHHLPDKQNGKAGTESTKQ